ncbi:MAG: polysaccharide deacetylase Est4B [Clostridia bacterium]|nr:polysaccharide deacetylase Est4B [Clostridia bacterium]
MYDVNKKCKIAFRMDDICPSMNWFNFFKVVEILNKINIKPLLGIIPNCEDPKLCCDIPDIKFFEILRRYKKEGFLMAQHGYNHVYVNKNGGILKINKQSEFAGLSFEEQLKKIKIGKEIMDEQDISTDIFMAPSHSYDINTVKALKALGFQYITDGYTNKNYKYCGIIFVPCKDVISIKHKMRGIKTVCIHANNMKDDDFKRLNLFIEKYSHCCMNFNELLNEKISYNWRINQQIELVRVRLYKALNNIGIIRKIYKLTYGR